MRQAVKGSKVMYFNIKHFAKGQKIQSTQLIKLTLSILSDCLLQILNFR